MIVYYRRGYDPEEVLDIVKVEPAYSSWEEFEWLILRDTEGQYYDATHFQEENGVWVATLSENW